MTNTPENFNPKVSIEVKKSLKRTIIQLQKSIEIINQQKIKDLPNLTIVDNLVESSNALVDYLQLKNFSNFDIKNSQQEDNFPENNIAFNPREEVKNSSSVSKKINKIKPAKINLILVILLIISISVNVFLGFLKPENVTNLAVNTLEEKQEIIEQNQEIKIEEKEVIKNIEIEKEEEIKEMKTIDYIDDMTTSIEEYLKAQKQSLNPPPEEIKKEDINSEPEIKLPLTPEEYLLTNIKEQIDVITNKYGKKLIVKITANLNQNNLTIYISDDWYKLKEGEQDNLVNDILDRVKNLDFYKFNLLDINGNLLARNAVVGKEFIITKRSIN